MLHVYPIAEASLHELEGTMCHCGPSVEFQDPITGEQHPEAIVIHKHLKQDTHEQSLETGY